MTGSENNTSQYTAESRLRRMDRHVRSSLERLHGIGSLCKSLEEYHVELKELTKVTGQVVERNITNMPAFIGKCLASHGVGVYKRMVIAQVPSDCFSK